MWHAAKHSAVILLLLGVITGGVGCRFMQRLQEQSYRDYHDSRMRCIAQADVSREFGMGWPSASDVPLVCHERTERTYRQLLQVGLGQDQARRDLLAESALTIDLLDRLVEALVGRDVPRIKRLAPELITHQKKLRQLIHACQAKSKETKARLADLNTIWLQLWPQCDLNFDLDGYTQQAWASSTGSVPKANREQLLHYYDSVYTRLAMTYLSYDPTREPDPEPFLPPGTHGLQLSLDQLEAALRARYNLDQAIEIDTAQLIEMENANLLPKEWISGVADPEQLAKHKAGAAVARLRLYRLADKMLGQCMGALQQEASWQWRHAWPDMQRETDILRYAASATAAQEPAAPSAISPP
jgi:hypothetical protein